MFDNFVTCIDGDRQLLVMAFSHEKLTMSLFAQQTKEIIPAMIIDIDAAAAPPTTATTGANTVTEPLAQESQTLHDAAATAEQLPEPQSQSLLDIILAAEGDTNKEIACMLG